MGIERCVVCDRGFTKRWKPCETGQGIAHVGCKKDAERGRLWIRGFRAPDGGGMPRMQAPAGEAWPGLRADLPLDMAAAVAMAAPLVSDA